MSFPQKYSPSIVSAQIGTYFNPSGDSPYWTVLGSQPRQLQNGTTRYDAVRAYSSNDLNNWIPHELPENFRTTRPISVCIHGGKIFIVWLPRSISEYNFYIASSPDGRNWSEARRLRFRGLQAPSMVSWRGRLWMANVGIGRFPWSNNHIYINTSEDGIEWPRGLKTDFKAGWVHLDTHLGTLQLIWVSDGSFNRHIYTSNSENGYTWNRRHKTRFRTSSSPTVIRCSAFAKRTVAWSQYWNPLGMQPGLVKLYIATGILGPDGLRFDSASAATTIDDVKPNSPLLSFSGTTDDDRKYLYVSTSRGWTTYTSLDGEDWTFQ